MDGLALLVYLIEVGWITGGGLMGAQFLKNGKKLGAAGAIIVVIFAALAFSYSVIGL